MDAIINYLIEPKRFDTQLFWCSPDVVALILILNLRFIFFVVFFIIFIFLLFLDHFFYILYVFSFPGTSQHIYVYLMTVNIFVQCVDVNTEKKCKSWFNTTRNKRTGRCSMRKSWMLVSKLSACVAVGAPSLSRAVDLWQQKHFLFWATVRISKVCNF